MKTTIKISENFKDSKDKRLFLEAAEFALHIANKEKIKLKTFSLKRCLKENTAYGLCYIYEGDIAILIRYKKKNTNKWHSKRLSKKFILDTVTHELAHLKTKTLNHGKKFYIYHRYLNEKYLNGFYTKY